VNKWQKESEGEMKIVQVLFAMAEINLEAKVILSNINDPRRIEDAARKILGAVLQIRQALNMPIQGGE